MAEVNPTTNLLLKSQDSVDGACLRLSESCSDKFLEGPNLSGSFNLG